MQKFIKLYLYKILSNITFGGLKQYYITKKEKYKKLVIQEKNKSNIKISDTGNKVDINTLSKLGVKLILNGDNNEIIVGEYSNLQGLLEIRLNGNNNIINLGNISTIVNLTIIAGFENNKTQNSKIIIKDGTSFNQVQIMILEHDSILEIGKECMFSGNIMLHLTDGHSITDYNGNLLNYGTNVKIGDKVWVGRNVTILKHAFIPNGTIVAMGSIVSKKYNEENTIIAGIPAKVVKRDILWQNTPPQVYYNKILETKKEANNPC